MVELSELAELEKKAKAAIARAEEKKKEIPATNRDVATTEKDLRVRLRMHH